MSMNFPQQVSQANFKKPVYVKEIKGAGAEYGKIQSYVRMDDIGNMTQVSSNHWEADSLSGLKNDNGTNRVYHFDNQTAGQILNQLA